MTEFIQFALLGLGMAAIFTLLAQGVVRIYQGSGVINFAQGAFALLSAIVYVQARSEGIPLAIALILATLTGALLGLLTQLLIMRQMRGTAPLGRMIATLGLLIVIQSAASLHYGDTAVIVPQFLPSHVIEVGSVSVQSDRLILFGIGVAVTIVLTLIDRYTLLGLATRATAADERTASTLGWSPARLAMINWTIGGALAGIAGALIVPLAGLQVSTLTLLIIPALAAALLARFESFPLALLGATAIGVAQSLISRYVTQPGAADAFPFLLIIIVLVFTGQSLPLREHISDRLPSIGSGVIRVKTLAVTMVATVGLLLILSTSWQDAASVTFSTGIVVLSIVVITGYAGQVSLAQYALGGLGAFAAGRLVAADGWPFWLAALAGILVSIPIGMAFALPALRTRGVNLAVVTLGLGVAVQELIFENSGYTGGFDGTQIGATKLFGLDVDSINHPELWAILALIAFTFSALLVANLRRGSAGRRLIAIRENERAAASLGVSVVGAKMYAFAFASAIASLGCILIAFRSTSIIYGDFSPFQSIYAVAFGVIGGIGYIPGAIVGSSFASGGFGSLLNPIFSGINDYLALISGVVVILMLISYPNGAFDQIAKWVRALLARMRRPVQDPPLPEGLLRAPQGAPRVEGKELVVKGLTVRFGEVVAVDDVDLSVKPGEIVGLIGPNGAGKTTFIDAVTGFVPSSGQISLAGEEMGRTNPARRVGMGLARSWQSLELFEDVSVLENMQIASEARSRRPLDGLRSLVRPGAVKLTPPAVMAIEEFGIGDSLQSKPSELSYGVRRLIGIARSVALSPSVLLLDEPAAGLSDAESRELGELLRRLADRWGLGILLIEHDVDLVMSLCDRVVVLDFGKKIAEASPGEIRNDSAVINAYLGAEIPA
jgi:sulfate-transporting ATPase